MIRMEVPYAEERCTSDSGAIGSVMALTWRTSTRTISRLAGRYSKDIAGLDAEVAEGFVTPLLCNIASSRYGSGRWTFSCRTYLAQGPWPIRWCLRSTSGRIT
jgi:hypothetical protein